MAEKSPIVIIGAGPSGLTMAVALARQGIPCRIFDKLLQATEQSRAVGIHARTMEVFDDIGIADEIAACSVHAQGISMFNAGKRILHIDYGRVESPFKFATLLPQNKTEAVLAKRAHGLGITVERGWELVNFSQNTSMVECLFKRGDGQEETLATPYLIGCDGAHSTVRHVLGLPFIGSSYKEDWVLADIQAKKLTDDEEIIGLFLNDKGLFLIAPLGDGHYRIAADHRAVDANEADPTEAEFRQLAAEPVAGKLQLVKFHWLSKFRIHHRKVPNYRDRRVFLVGDSAHIHSPAGGQGMNTGIQDAYNLAWKLALAQQGIASASLLDSYYEERGPVAEAVLQDTHALTKMMSVKQPWLQALRNIILPMVAQWGVVQRYFVNKASQLAVNYRHSRIVDEDWQGHYNWQPGFHKRLKAGDRAPEIILWDIERENNVSLFTLLHGTKHQAVFFIGKVDDESLAAMAEIRVHIQQKYADLVECQWVLLPGADLEKTQEAMAQGNKKLSFYRDSGNLCEKCYSTEPDKVSLYIIRPDGYIGYHHTALSWKRCESHLNKIFRN